MRRRLRHVLRKVMPQIDARTTLPQQDSSTGATQRSEDEVARATRPDSTSLYYAEDLNTGSMALPDIPRYEYEGIGQDEIRLLTITPEADTSKPVHCLLTSYRRSEHAGYVAVSYTWGNVEDKVAIGCNGRHLLIGRNCHDALHALRDAVKPRTVWIDAICINQSDPEERQIQVANMGEIYRQASETFAYLGKSSQDWDGLHNIGNSQWQSLLENPWFTRTWVIQEVLLSRRITIILSRNSISRGSERIPWLDFISLCSARARKLRLPRLVTMRADFVHDYGRRPPKSWDEVIDTEYGDDVLAALDRTSCRPQAHPAQGASSSSSSHVMVSDAKSPPERIGQGLAVKDISDQQVQEEPKGSGYLNLNYWRLAEILESTHDFQCQDPRDKLFAILPLFLRPIPELLYPDYQKSANQVFTDLAWFLIREGDLAAFRYLSSVGAVDLPSWVTYWPHSKPSPGWWQVAHQAKVGFGSRARECRPVLVAEDKRLLRLRGIKVGRVDRLAVAQRVANYATRGKIRVNLEMYAIPRTTQGLQGSFALSWEVFDRQGNGTEALCQTIRLVSNRVLEDVIAMDSDTLTQGETYTMEASKYDTMRLQSSIDCANIEKARKSALRSFRTYGNDEFGSLRESFSLPEFSIAANVEHRFTLEYEHTIDANLEDREAIENLSADKNLEQGDVVCVILGFQFPFVLRPIGDHWRMIGQCWLNDQYFMSGDFLEALDVSDWWAEPCPAPLQDFIIC